MRRAIGSTTAVLLAWSFAWGCAGDEVRLGDTRDASADTPSPPSFVTPEETGNDAAPPPESVRIMCIQTECPEPYTTCPWDETKCETNLSTNSSHCGACGHECASLGPYMLSRCVDGTCVPECMEERQDCNGLREDGCEVRIMVDPDHCGACGRKCPEGTSCSKGQCESCPSGSIDCGRGCVFTETDPRNCGACGNVCSDPPDAAAPPPNMKYSCWNSECGRLVCVVGWANCNGTLDDCCEVNIGGDDPENCGACGNACGPNQLCRGIDDTGLRCVCAPNETMCGDPERRIWCADLLSDPLNCGACGRDCPGGGYFDNPGMTPYCRKGLCGYTCLPGYGDCDGQTQNGCETDLLKNPDHCGACGNQCDVAAGQPCVEGACLVTECDAGGPR